MLASQASDWRPYREPGTLTLAAASVAVDFGLFLPSINDDFMGSGPDMGALELGGTLPEYGVGGLVTPPPPPPPPPPGTGTSCGCTLTSRTTLPRAASLLLLLGVCLMARRKKAGS